MASQIGSGRRVCDTKVAFVDFSQEMGSAPQQRSPELCASNTDRPHFLFSRTRGWRPSLLYPRTDCPGRNSAILSTAPTQYNSKDAKQIKNPLSSTLHIARQLICRVTTTRRLGYCGSKFQGCQCLRYWTIRPHILHIGHQSAVGCRLHLRNASAYCTPMSAPRAMARPSTSRTRLSR